MLTEDCSGRMTAGLLGRVELEVRVIDIRGRTLATVPGLDLVLVAGHIEKL